MCVDIYDEEFIGTSLQALHGSLPASRLSWNNMIFMLA